ncbi:phage holin family protein [Chryseobacterium sp. MDT2-18]|uniref:phage holin family protein n=1 Tax=Chryseobacterium sp. MDT2-18 TaxID=1259136 RepID=UPI00277F56C3|nr:phage holin family protein [Chryseobacterium sp. MDT2-18]MDQ0475763.1 putative membrane protein [Chryseobacterium sp. MDT2-18]
MVDIVKEFASKKIDLLKMEMTEKSSLTVGTLTYLVLASVAALFFIILFNIGLGLLIGFWLGNYAYGILIMAGFYLLILIITFAVRNTIRNKVADKIIKFINS